MLTDARGGLTLRTSPLIANILPSVTRTYVLRAANDVGLSVVEDALTCAEAAQARELFIAMTTHDIVPVVRFEGKRTGDGRPGRLPRDFMRKCRQFVG